MNLVGKWSGLGREGTHKMKNRREVGQVKINWNSDR